MILVLLSGEPSLNRATRLMFLFVVRKIHYGDKLENYQSLFSEMNQTNNDERRQIMNIKYQVTIITSSLSIVCLALNFIPTERLKG